MTDLPYRLRLPGPTQVPARVRAASAQPIVSHRGPEFHAVMRDAQAMLHPVFGAAGPILLFAASGTGMMEAALANILGPGSRALVVANGQFGERFAAIARGLGGIVDTIEVPWSEAVDPALVEARLGNTTTAPSSPFTTKARPAWSPISPRSGASPATVRRCSSPTR